MTANKTVTRTPGGAADSSELGPLGDYASYRPFRYHDWWNDFDNFVAAEWITTKSVGSPAPAIANGDGGILAVATDAVATDFEYLQYAGNSGAAKTTWLWESNKDMFIQCGFSVDDPTNSNIFIGLEQVTTTPFTFLDSIGFYKPAGQTTGGLQTKAGSTVGNINLTAYSLVAATSLEVTIAYTAVDQTFRIWITTPFVSGSPNVGSTIQAAGSATAASLGFNSTNQMTMTLAMLNNAVATAHTLSVDYLLFAKQRLING